MNSNVAIVMPLGRLSPWFREALESALMQETKAPVHLIANALSKEDLGILRTLSSERQGIYVHEFSERLPMVSNWNRMLSAVDYKFIAILHDDDLLEPWTIRKLSEAASRLPDRGIYLTKERLINEDGNFYDDQAPKNEGSIRDLDTEESISWAILNRIFATGFMLDLTKARELGGFDESIGYSPDWDLYFSLCSRYGACFVDVHGGRYRFGSATGQLSSKLARSGDSIASYRTQQLVNIGRMGLSPESVKAAMASALAIQAKMVNCHYAECLDSNGILVVRNAIKEGIVTRFGEAAEILLRLPPLNFAINRYIDYRYRSLRTTYARIKPKSK